MTSNMSYDVAYFTKEFENYSEQVDPGSSVEGPTFKIL